MILIPLLQYFCFYVYLLLIQPSKLRRGMYQSTALLFPFPIQKPSMFICPPNIFSPNSLTEKSMPLSFSSNLFSRNSLPWLLHPNMPSASLESKLPLQTTWLYLPVLHSIAAFHYQQAKFTSATYFVIPLYLYQVTAVIIFYHVAWLATNMPFHSWHSIMNDEVHR